MAAFLLGLVLALALQAAPPRPTRQFDVLVVPPSSTPRPLAEIPPELIEATLDGRDLRVLGVKPISAASGSPLVVFIDSRGTKDDLDARLFDEVAPLLDTLRRRRNTLVLVDGCDVQGAFDFVNFRSHSALAVLKDQAHTMRPAAADCQSYLKGIARFDGARLVTSSFDAALMGVSAWFPKDAGPVRAIQLSGDFRWLEPGLNDREDYTSTFAGYFYAAPSPGWRRFSASAP